MRWSLGDASTAQAGLLSTLLAAIAEFERELIRERTGEGRKGAMANAVKFGRESKNIDREKSLPQGLTCPLLQSFYDPSSAAGAPVSRSAYQWRADL
jgi:resolvase-like protein